MGERGGATEGEPIARQSIWVRGQVQGVGFRPYVFRVASGLALGGVVYNQTDGVTIEVEGPRSTIEHFARTLAKDLPPLAKIFAIETHALEPIGERVFRIVPSTVQSGGQVAVAPDVATCAACLDELFDPRDRRHLYPFINCSHCGPRLTIMRAAPYDRSRTTMASFPMCADCAREYGDPNDRRFHAEPIACPVCGPRLQLDESDRERKGDPIERAAELLLRGLIGAIKSLGGYHLACDATDETAVSTLRARKRREAKPFAVMVADLTEALELAEVGEHDRLLLASPARPIVLCGLKARTPLAPAVTSGFARVGLMLPFTPLHHLLLDAVKGRPLVMTSGNHSDEPIAYHDEEARTRLSAIADFFLRHDRPIHTRCDDSVVQIVAGAPSFIRRARGFAPGAERLTQPLSAVTLAVGGHMKSTFALGAGDWAVLSHHLGDLGHAEAAHAFRAAIAHHEELFQEAPTRLVHDLHPDYASTVYAEKRAQEEGLERIAVQHHHAHLAACLSENGVRGSVIGVVFDGTGLGEDGAIWGGEFLIGDCANVNRAAHLAYVPLPGGERAIREPWRMALSHLISAGIESDRLAIDRVSPESRKLVAQMIAQKIHSPETSSMGRLFDAAAILVGLPERARFDGEPAMRLEALALAAAPDEPYPFALLSDRRPLVIDPSPLFRALVADRERAVPPERIARRFHSAVAHLVAEVCERLRNQTGLAGVALSGGVFINSVLTMETEELLRARHFEVFRHRRLPPSDGGLSFGQLAVAAARDHLELL